MAISREMKYTMNLGIFGMPSTLTTHFVGGSPITIVGGSFSYGEKGANDWLVSTEGQVEGVNPGTAAPYTFDVMGVAWFGDEGPNEEFLPKDTVTVLGFPLYATLFKGENEPTPPFDPSRTYSEGDLLRPTTITVGGDTYAVWTNDNYPGSAVGQVFYGKVMAVEGSGANATLVVFFSPMFVIAS